MKKACEKRNWMIFDEIFLENKKRLKGEASYLLI